MQQYVERELSYNSSKNMFASFNAIALHRKCLFYLRRSTILFHKINKSINLKKERQKQKIMLFLMSVGLCIILVISSLAQFFLV